MLWLRRRTSARWSGTDVSHNARFGNHGPAHAATACRPSSGHTAANSSYTYTAGAKTSTAWGRRGFFRLFFNTLPRALAAKPAHPPWVLGESLPAHREFADSPTKNIAETSTAIASAGTEVSPAVAVAMVVKAFFDCVGVIVFPNSLL
jgi:hypothetical protein